MWGLGGNLGMMGNVRALANSGSSSQLLRLYLSRPRWQGMWGNTKERPPSHLQPPLMGTGNRSYLGCLLEARVPGAWRQAVEGLSEAGRY